LRPGCVYGKHSSLLGHIIFKNLAEGKTTFAGTGANCWATVHVDDNADAYVKAVLHGPSIRGQVFNIVSQSERFSDIVDGSAAVIGAKGPFTYAPPQDPFSEALAVHQRFNTTKARTVLGWTPKRSSILNNIPLLHSTWKSHN